MTEVLSVFDPFQQMMIRPIPKTYSKKRKESRESESESESDSPDSESKSPNLPIVLSLSSKVEINREDILEKLRKTKNWITRCDTPLKYAEDSDYEFENEGLEEPETETETETEKEKEEVEEEEELEEEVEEELETEKEEELETEPEVVEEPPKKGKKEKKEKEPKEKKEKVKKGETIDLAKVKLGEWQAHLPKPEKRIVKTPFYMNNRKKFIQKLNDLFSKYRLEIGEEDKNAISCKSLRQSSTGDFVPLMHQKVIRDYLNLYTPYRGVLLYHSLGSGKSSTSIAIAEGFKTEKRIFVMLPASLKTNYWVEIQKAGDPLYKKNQYWEFVDTVELFPVLAKALNLTMEEVRKRGGAWMVDIRKEPNYNTLTSENQLAVDIQIQEMIQNKYADIHYNAPNLKKIVDTLILNKNGQNPFSHSVVIIDEAHNFISRIVGKLKVSNAIFSRLYHLLMDAEDCRLVLLSGTPIINYPHEMAVMFNLLRGYIKTWVFKVVVSTNKEVNQKTILNILENAGLKTYDFIQYANNKLILTRNPFGFSNVQTQGAVKKGGKTQKKIVIKGHANKTKNNKTKRGHQEGGIGAEMVGYKGVLKNPDYMTNIEFVKTVIKVMEMNGITLKPADDQTKDILIPKLEKALYDNPDKFRETFIEEIVSEKDKSILLNVNVLKNRILGLTSYFRSAQESLLPNFVPNEKGEDIHVIEVPMSDYQLGKYAIIRKEEYEKESKAAKRKKLAVPVQGNGVNAKDLFSMASSYRIFSRASCNFVFPESIERPRPPSKFTDENEEKDTDESVVADGEGGEEEGAPENYQKNILDTMATLKKESKNIFSKEKLREYSPKFLEMLQNIQEPLNDGLHLVYSNFRTLEGIGIFQMVLEENGMREFTIQKKGGIWTFDVPSENEKRRYVLYTGTETEEQKEIIRNIYNGSWETLSREMRESLEKMDKTGKKNADGLIIQVFMITSAGAEGINLRNTRFVHIMEPYWHNVRLEQVIGRARRICSHEDLPLDKRTVKVFVYLSVMSELQKKSDKYTELRIHDVSKLDAGKPITTDENLFEIAGFKTKINSQFLRVIKETAVDCSLYVAKHNQKEKTPLVCYGFGKVNSNEFATHPILETDLKEAPVGGPVEQRVEKFKGKIVTVNGVKYALNPGTNELYNLDNYKNKILTFEGMYDPLKKEMIGTEEVERRPILPPPGTVLEMFDLAKLSTLAMDVKDNRINASFTKSNPILLFFLTKLRPSFFPFVTNEREIQLYVKTACNIQPPLDNYDAKYNRDKFESPVYQNMQKKSILTTIDYVFDKMKMGVYVRICNNVLTNFMPLYNLAYVNDFSQLLQFKNKMTAKEYFAKKDPRGRGKWNMDLSKWVATGCLLRNEADDDSPTLAYLSAFYDMIVETCHFRKVADCVFLLNRKDFPYLDKTWNESFTDIYGENVPMQPAWKNQSFVPILSQSSSDRHADIPIPTGDDWNNITQKYFADKMKEFESPEKTGFGYENVYIYNEKKNPIPSWEKRKPVFFWRGMGTGCGNSVDNNPRLKLTQLSQQEDLKSILDAGITKFTRRDKKVLGQPYVEYTENTEKLVFKPKVERFDQLEYKFTLNVEGNSAAYRFGSLFKLGFCILNVKSQYKMWFEPFLEDMKHCIFIEHDLSNLEERMQWCLAHDAECKQIAENGRQFYDKYFTKDFVFDYLADIFNKTGAMIGPNYQVDEQEKIRRKNDKKYNAFEFVSYDKIVKPEMDAYKRRFKITYDTFQSTTQTRVPNGTLIIVPFRENKFQNRGEQLQQFIRHYSVLDIPILIVTQSDDGYGFNRGKLLNIGYHFSLANSKKKIDKFIFHDVDLLFPVDFVKSYYGTKAGGEIVHFGKNAADYYDYPDFLGGVIQFSKNAFEKINGFPNHIYGWGGEDDALKVRIASLKIPVQRPDIPKMKVKMEFGPGEQETKDVPELVAKYKNEDLLVDESIWKMNGVNSLLYTIVNNTTMSPGVFNITVDIH